MSIGGMIAVSTGIVTLVVLAFNIGFHFNKFRTKHKCEVIHKTSEDRIQKNFDKIDERFDTVTNLLIGGDYKAQIKITKEGDS